MSNTSLLNVEPHKDLLKKPPKETLLYKIASYDNFLDMLDKNYLYFRRVDKYFDDTDDSNILQSDSKIFKAILSKKRSNFTVLDYYRECRSRTYACCFSISENKYLWQNYGGKKSDKVALVFNADLLIESINHVFSVSKIQYGNQLFKNIFFINYGLVIYGSREEDILIKDRLPNPIQHAYFKDKKYRQENEFRITLSTIGIGKISNLNFPDSIKLLFDFKKIIYTIKINPCFIETLKNDLKKRNIYTL